MESKSQSMSIIVGSETTDFTTDFHPPIELDSSSTYDMALIRLETYYSFPNIDDSNNMFRYSPNKGANWFNIVLPEGSYEINKINEAIKDAMKANDHYDKSNNNSFIEISPNRATLKAKIEISHEDYEVDFSVNNSLSQVLGFSKKIYKKGRHEGERPVNILSINSILVHCDVIGGSYVNGSQETVIYSFFPDVEPGMKIIEKPSHIV